MTVILEHIKQIKVHKSMLIFKKEINLFISIKGDISSPYSEKY